jgi:hypothetical protein
VQERKKKGMGEGECLFNRQDQVKVGKGLERFEPNTNDWMGKTVLKCGIYVLI